MKRRIEPGPDRESVWDYPRPPKLEACSKSIRVILGQVTLAETNKAFRILETSHPPVYYLPPEDIRMDLLRLSPHGSVCEWKGRAHYYCYFAEEREIIDIAWAYKNPSDQFSPIAGYLAFYPSKVDACFVNQERVSSQEGDFYGGWITKSIVGPFKGGPGTHGW